MIQAGRVIYAGVDYERILREAQTDADVIMWDGGNNDFPFYESDLLIVVVDPLRPDHALHYHPGEATLRMADVILVSKVGTASFEETQHARDVARRLNPTATVIEAASPIVVDGGEQMRGKRVLVIEDGPTLTHGGMPFGAGWVAARRYGAAEIVDPRPHAVGSIREVYAKYPSTGPVLPAMGYGPQQTLALEATVEQVPADLVVIGTPIDLRRVITFSKPALRVQYRLQEIGEPTLTDVLEPFLE